MTWTGDKPTVPGWFWVYWNTLPPSSAWVQPIYSTDDGLWYGHPEDSESRPLSSVADGFWYWGPIPVPYPVPPTPGTA